MTVRDYTIDQTRTLSSKVSNDKGGVGVANAYKAIESAISKEQEKRLSYRKAHNQKKAYDQELDIFEYQKQECEGIYFTRKPLSKGEIAGIVACSVSAVAGLVLLLCPLSLTLLLCSGLVFTGGLIGSCIIGVKAGSGLTKGEVQLLREIVEAETKEILQDVIRLPRSTVEQLSCDGASEKDLMKLWKKMMCLKVMNTRDRLYNPGVFEIPNKKYWGQYSTKGQKLFSLFLRMRYKSGYKLCMESNEIWQKVSIGYMSFCREVCPAIFSKIAWTPVYDQNDNCAFSAFVQFLSEELHSENCNKAEILQTALYNQGFCIEQNGAFTLTAKAGDALVWTLLEFSKGWLWKEDVSQKNSIHKMIADKTTQNTSEFYKQVSDVVDWCINVYYDRKENQKR